MDAVVPRFQFEFLMDRTSSANTAIHSILADTLVHPIGAVQKLFFALGAFVIAGAARANAGLSVFRVIG